MLTWGLPAALWLGTVLVPITVLYFLRMRFQRQPVSSTYLWSRLQQMVRGGTHLRWWTILLLLVQLLAAGMAVAAVAQPVWTTRHLAGPGVVYLLDVSASMSAMEGDRSRLDRARSLLAEEIRRLPAGTPAAIFLCGAGPEPLAEPTTNGNELLARLEGIKEGATGFDEEAVAEKLQAWLAAQGRPWRACLVSDGGLDLGGRRLAGLFGNGFRVLTVGSEARNLGLTGLRLLSGGRVRFSAFNGGQTGQTVGIRLERDGKPLAGARVLLSPGYSRHTLDLPQGEENLPGVYAALLEQPPDALPADDRTFLAVPPAHAVRVLLAGPPNPFLRAALRQPGVELVEAPAVGSGEFDLIVADRVAIPPGLQGILLAFGQAPPDGPVRMGEPLNGGGRLVSEESAHPLLRFVDWQDTAIAGGHALELDPGGQALATAGGQPVLAAWETRGRHCAVWGTTLFASDLGLSGGFPIFLQNFLQWCVPQMNNPLAYTLTAGVPAVLAEPPSWEVESGPFRVERRGTLVTVRALAPGVFNWRRGQERGALAVNIPASELEIAAKPLPVGETSGHIAAQYTSGERSLGQWAAGVFLCCLCLEWILWRGSRPRGGGGRNRVV